MADAREEALGLISTTIEVGVERDRARIAKFLDDLASRSVIGLDEMARRVQGMMRVFPEIDWLTALEAAGDREEEKEKDAYMMDALTDKMATFLMRQRRSTRRGE